jgi:hypothetical protein
MVNWLSDDGSNSYTSPLALSVEIGKISKIELLVGVGADILDAESFKSTITRGYKEKLCWLIFRSKN